MFSVKNKTLLLLLFLYCFLTSCSCEKQEKNQSKNITRTVTDIEGKRICVPEKVERVVCLDVLCYSIMMTLQQVDKVVSIQQNSGRSPWTDRVHPHRSIPIMASFPGVEEILKLKPDVIIGGYGGTKESAQFARMGLVQINAQPRGRIFNSAQEFMQSQKAMMRIYGDVLGPNATKRVEEWCHWYDSLIKRIEFRTHALPAEKRPKTYFVRGPSVLATHGRGGASYWYGTLAGANMVVKENQEIRDRGEVAMESLVHWNPEVMLMDRQYSADVVMEDPRLKNVDAIRNHRIFSVPGGVFYWDGGPESALLLPWLAKTLHPELFPDLDLRGEVQAYYAMFYQTLLSDQEADMLLHGLDSHGKRENLWGT